MPERITMESLEQYLSFFSKMYDIVRLVDPERKCVLEYRENRLAETKSICHAYWQRGVICDNCISVRAYREDKLFYKLEQALRTIMVVTAIPVHTAERTVVLETLKDATETMLLGSGDYASGKPLDRVVQELNSMVVKDHLTGVFNRRFLDERLPCELILSRVHRQPLTIIFADIDNMKYVNDTFGHMTGDMAIQMAGGTLRQSVRSKKDWVARYGGDEFVICLPDSEEKAAGHVIRRIRQRIGCIRPPEGKDQIEVRLSFGVQTVSGESLTAEEMIRMADQKMYAAKHRRRQAPPPVL